MKLRYILTSLLACLAFAVGCVQEELPGLSDIEVAPSYFTFGVDGGSKDVTVNTSSDWTVGDIPEWLTVNPASGKGEGKFTVTATASTDTLTRTAYLKVKAGEEVQLVTVNQDAFVPAFPAFKGGEYWIMTRDKASVVFPIDDGGQGYGYMNVVKSVDGKSTADNIYTFAPVEGETDGFTIVDTKGQYHIGSTYNSFTVSKTNPKDGSEVWYVKQISADEFEITNKTNGKTIFMSTYGNFCPYSKGDAKVVTENPYPCLVSASGDDAVEVKFAVEPKEVALKKEAGEFTIDMTCRNEGFEIKPSVSWIVLKGMTSTDGEYEVTFSYAENTAGARTATIDFISGEEKFVVEVSQEGSIVDATVAEFLAAEIGPALFKLTGKVEKLQAGDYGNFTLVDATGSVYVYGLTATKVEKNDKSFKSLGIKEGDIVTLIGTRAGKDGKPEVGGPAYYVSHIGHTEVTIAEFLTKEKSADNWYKLTGTIEEIVKEEYGNFYLKDDTGRVFVYGLTVAPVAKNDKSFAKLGLKVGDKVTLIGTKDYFEKSSVEDQKHQVGGPAYYISHETPAEGGDDTETPAGNVLSLTNAEICAAMTSSETSYQDYTIESASGVWTVNASRNSANTFLQCRGKNGAYIKTPAFEKDIKYVTLYFSEEKSVYADNVFCVFPSTWTAPTEKDKAYPEDGNVGRAVTDGTYTLKIPVNAGNKQVSISLIRTNAYYIDHIDVEF